MQHAVTTVTFDLNPKAARSTMYVLEIQDGTATVDVYHRVGSGIKHANQRISVPATVSGMRQIALSLSRGGVRVEIDEDLCDIYLDVDDETPVLAVGTMADNSLCVMSNRVVTVVELVPDGTSESEQ